MKTIEDKIESKILNTFKVPNISVEWLGMTRKWYDLTDEVGHVTFGIFKNYKKHPLGHTENPWCYAKGSSWIKATFYPHYYTIKANKIYKDGDFGNPKLILKKQYEICCKTDFYEAVNEVITKLEELSMKKYMEDIF